MAFNNVLLLRQQKEVDEVHDLEEAAKRSRCSSCSRNDDKKVTTECFNFCKFICQQHLRVNCVLCRLEKSCNETDYFLTLISDRPKFVICREVRILTYIEL